MNTSPSCSVIARTTNPSIPDGAVAPLLRNHGTVALSRAIQHSASDGPKIPY